MEVALSVIGAAILNPLFESLFHSLTSLKYPRDEHVQAEFEKWESMVRAIRGVLDATQKLQNEDGSVKQWVRELRNLAYDAEDILEEFNVQTLRHQLPVSPSSSHNSRTLMPSCCSPGRIKFNASMITKIRRITSRFEGIINQKEIFESFGGNNGGVHERTRQFESTSLVDKTGVYGREKDREAVLELVMAEVGDSGIGVIPIVGVGGIGKTTLAQLVYNDEKLEFDFKIWVYVGLDFDVTRMTRIVLESIGEDSNAYDLNNLQVKVEKKLLGKKVLIVLDDVWNENFQEWRGFSVPFKEVRRESRIIVTTRLKNVSYKMGTLPEYVLQELSHDDCSSVFQHHAFKAGNFDDYPSLKKVGNAIVGRCQGLPLAAEALGGLVRGKLDCSSWEEVLHSKIWDLPEDKTGILPALRVSYYHLPNHLKRCFAYCGIFPKETEFGKDELVLLWMAEGFLQQSKVEKQAKDLGNEYFLELQSRSLFQTSIRNKSLYVMHDMVNDLARSVGGELFFNLDDKLKEERAYAEVRHVTFVPHHYDIARRFEVLNKMKNLRTFFALPISGSWNHNLSCKVLYDLIPQLRCLRVLSLSRYNITELPSSIGALQLLQYLDMSHTQIERLPKSLGKLLNLQILKLRGCQKLIKLPATLGNLIKMQSIDLSDTPSLQELPFSIGNLTKLHTLTKFIIGNGSGRRIAELTKLPHLQGELHILGLHNVINIQDVDRALLREKHGLDEIVFEWIDDFNGLRHSEDELQILKLLQPQKNLVSLSIKSYGGTLFPSWVGDLSFDKMVFLELCNCRRIISFPQLKQLPSLRSLNIKGMDGIREVGVEFCEKGSSSVDVFPALKTLKFEDMLEWEQWYWSNNLNEHDAGIFPNLQKLIVRNCPKLAGKLPGHLCSLQELDVFHCPKLAGLPEMLPSLQKLKIEECKEDVFRSFPNFSSLTTFTIENISGLKNLNEVFMQSLMALEVVEIMDCDELEYLWEDGSNIYKLDHLKRLVIENCVQLVSLVKDEDGMLPCNLQVLEIRCCSNFEKFSNRLYCLTSLSDLSIVFSRKLESFPVTGLPTCLKHLEVSFCDSLQSLPTGIMRKKNDDLDAVHLEKLELLDCPCLGSFQIGEFPKSLQVLAMCHASEESLESIWRLPHLTELEISDCQELNFFPISGLVIPNLVSLTLWDLKCLPSSMDSFTSLRRLEMHDCQGLLCFPEGCLPLNLSTLKIWDCKDLTQPISEWGLHRLTSLQRLQIVGPIPGADMVSFPDDNGLLLPKSLAFLDIGRFENLKSIARGLRKLNFLRVLWFWSCPRLRSFPKQGLPDSLGCLGIDLCPSLEKRCTKGKGDYWLIIADIPLIRINFCSTIGAEIQDFACFDFRSMHWNDDYRKD